MKNNLKKLLLLGLKKKSSKFMILVKILKNTYLKFKALSYNLADRFPPLPYVIKYQISQNMNPEPNALDWLLVHVKYIALFDFEDEISYECKVPYRQCIYCGALDKFEAPKYMVNTKYIEFDERKRFCHDVDCKTLSGPNPEVHNPHCHYAIFSRKKKTLIDRIKKSHSADEAIKIFLDFCEKQLKENLNIKYIVRTKEIADMDEFGYGKLTDFSISVTFEGLFLSDKKLINNELKNM